MAKKNGSVKHSRRSKAESSTGAKDSAVEMRKGELDLQPVEIQSADFAMHFKAAKSNKELAERYQGKFRENIAAAKKVSPHLASAVKLALKMDGADPEAIKAALAVESFVLKELGCAVQITMHDMLMGSAGEVAGKRGYDDGKAGRAMNNQYPEGSDLSEIYAKSWTDGQAELMGGVVIGHNSGDGTPELIA